MNSNNGRPVVDLDSYNTGIQVRYGEDSDGEAASPPYGSFIGLEEDLETRRASLTLDLLGRA